MENALSEFQLFFFHYGVDTVNEPPFRLDTVSPAQLRYGAIPNRSCASMFRFNLEEF
jgi:hypothetical protein